MDLDKILNDLLNRALIGKNRIKQVNSNEISEFVNNYLESINLTPYCAELKIEKCNICNKEKDCQGHAVCEDCGGRSF